MSEQALRVGFAICGSFCTFSQAIPVIGTLREQGCDVYPIMSPIAYETTTRFGRREDIIEQVKALSDREIITTIPQAEPIGPKKLLDVMVVAPCTGNTLGKLACGITDTSVTRRAVFAGGGAAPAPTAPPRSQGHAGREQ